MFFVFDRIIKNSISSKAISWPRHLIGDFFTFNFTPNYYISFSLPIGGVLLNWIILSIILILLFITIYLILAKKYKNNEYLPLTFIIFGAISNVLDRFNYGYVIDYLDLKYFTVFNLADTMITIGVCWLIYLNLKATKKYV